MEQTLALHAVTKRFGDRLAVDGVAFTARSGLVTGLIGPNGAGKTTIMRMLTDIVRPDEGRIDVLGQPATRHLRRRLGYLPEERGVYGKMRALDVLVYFAQLRGLSRRAAREASRDWLERVGLGDRAGQFVETLSKGQAQLVQLGCALVHDPELLILDEPMSGLDPLAADLVRDIVFELAHARKKTVLLSTHDLEGAERLCEDLVMIHRGRVVLHGETADIKAEYGHSSIVIFFEGDAAFLHRHPAVARVGLYGGYADIELAEDASASELLRDCAARLTINRYERVKPSLAEIFRRTVEGAS